MCTANEPKKSLKLSALLFPRRCHEVAGMGFDSRSTMMLEREQGDGDRKCLQKGESISQIAITRRSAARKTHAPVDHATSRTNAFLRLDKARLLSTVNLPSIQLRDTQRDTQRPTQSMEPVLSSSG
jgi:hypothetical protein